jgi:hypothetical protein
MPGPPRELLEFLFRHDPAIQSLTLALRTLVVGELAPCHEYIFAMGAKVVLVYGPTERVIGDCVCSIAVHRKHINLGFPHGSELTDATGALEGTGKRWRHVSIRRLSDLDRPEVRRLVRQAWRYAGIKRPRGASADQVVTRVKPPSERRTRQSVSGLVKP